MRFRRHDTVSLGISGIPGVVIYCLEAIPQYHIEPWYNVNWVDGNTSLHAESELFKISKLRDLTNEECYSY
ncbi:hypothetical protein [Klebsiella phage vB_Kpn_P545]|uniref:Uncharacterized protein n=1 Tax=Klebsiella phage vB_Kpn_P545 TaxID=2686283 RepID=A0A6B9J5W4_9CAUD|nr:hypothetical protein [Klebsiella phage vB_Kpn_P545]